MHFYTRGFLKFSGGIERDQLTFLLVKQKQTNVRKTIISEVQKSKIYDCEM